MKKQKQNNIDFILHAFNINPQEPIKTQKIRQQDPFGDYDKDKVPNWRDCQPFNPKKHGVEPNILMEQRIRSIRVPFYVTDVSIPENGKQLNTFLKQGYNNQYFDFMSNEARSHAPIARKIVLSMFKLRPDLITQIKTKRPSTILITSKPSISGDYGEARYIRANGRRGGMIIIYGEPKEERTGTMRHELEHIKQFRKVRRGEVSARKLEKGEYEERPEEKQAYRAEERFQRKLRQKGDFWSGYRRIFE